MVLTASAESEWQATTVCSFSDLLDLLDWVFSHLVVCFEMVLLFVDHLREYQKSGQTSAGTPCRQTFCLAGKKCPGASSS